MTIDAQPEDPNSLIFLQTWTACNATAQRLNAVFIDSFRRLSEARTQASTEACMEAFSQMIMIISASSLAQVLAAWPPLLKSAQNREAKVQQRNLEIWSSALQATTALFTEGAPQNGSANPEAGVSAAWPDVERRVSARLIDFPERRAAAADSTASSASQGVRVKRPGAAARL